ncbi:uncharacterized protein LOC143222161 [Tachypleus tridentatus]|uniref:uncharacterized protein LOC143222161 n=1 Tax=Tachypleus tridentatus TaxID=6853 RepID=UPI003FD0C70D
MDFTLVVWPIMCFMIIKIHYPVLANDVAEDKNVKTANYYFPNIGQFLGLYSLGVMKLMVGAQLLDLLGFSYTGSVLLNVKDGFLDSDELSRTEEDICEEESSNDTTTESPVSTSPYSNYDSAVGQSFHPNFYQESYFSSYPTHNKFLEVDKSRSRRNTDKVEPNIQHRFGSLFNHHHKHSSSLHMSNAPFNRYPFYRRENHINQEDPEMVKKKCKSKKAGSEQQSLSISNGYGTKNTMLLYNSGDLTMTPKNEKVLEMSKPMFQNNGIIPPFNSYIMSTNNPGMTHNNMKFDSNPSMIHNSMMFTMNPQFMSQYNPLANTNKINRLHNKRMAHVISTTKKSNNTPLTTHYEPSEDVREFVEVSQHKSTENSSLQKYPQPRNRMKYPWQRFRKT